MTPKSIRELMAQAKDNRVTLEDLRKQKAKGSKKALRRNPAPAYLRHFNDAETAHVIYGDNVNTDVVAKTVATKNKFQIDITLKQNPVDEEMRTILHDKEEKCSISLVVFKGRLRMKPMGKQGPMVSGLMSLTGAVTIGTLDIKSKSPRMVDSVFDKEGFSAWGYLKSCLKRDLVSEIIKRQKREDDMKPDAPKAKVEGQPTQEEKPLGVISHNPENEA